MSFNPISSAADLIHTGWTQGGYYRIDALNHVSYCSLGALNKVACGEAENDAARSEVVLLAEVIRENYPEAWEKYQAYTSGYGTAAPFVVAWNDTKGRTLAEVTAMFEKAAVKWEERA